MFKGANFENSDDIKQFLKNYIIEGESTSEDVEQILTHNAIKYSKSNLDIFPYPEDWHVVRDPRTPEFDTYIAFKIPNSALKPRTLRQLWRGLLLKEFATVYRVFLLVKDNVVVYVHVIGDKIAL
ncbi:MAG: hypothetical protein AAFQ07_03065 [Chloroflexota bacterium]